MHSFSGFLNFYLMSFLLLHAPSQDITLCLIAMPPLSPLGLLWPTLIWMCWFWGKDLLCRPFVKHPFWGNLLVFSLMIRFRFWVWRRKSIEIKHHFLGIIVKILHTRILCCSLKSFYLPLFHLWFTVTLRSHISIFQKRKPRSISPGNS